MVGGTSGLLERASKHTCTVLNIEVSKIMREGERVAVIELGSGWYQWVHPMS